MAEYALMLLRNEEMMKSYKQACLDRASDHFDIDKITAQYEQVYSRVLTQQNVGVGLEH